LLGNKISILAAIMVGPLLAGQGIARTSTPDRPDDDAEALIQAGHWKRARAILAPQVTAHPDDPRDCYLLAEVKMAFQFFDGALPLAQHAVELDGKNSDYHLKLGQIYGELAARASFFSAGSLAVKFRKEVEIAIQLNPKNLDALDSMMLFKYQAPGILGGSKDEARALADRIAALNPSEGNLAHAELADLEKNPPQVEACYLKAVQANPRNYGAQTALAKYYSQTPHAKYEEAVKHAQSAVQLAPQRIEGYWILARVFALQQRWGELEQILAASEKNIPDDRRPLYEAAQGLMETGKELPRAEGYAEKYLAQDMEGGEPGVGDTHLLLGLIFEKEGSIDAARAEFHRALRYQSAFKAAKDNLKRLHD
jgi:tetratricopeptide (TPR) repeat protein